MQRNIRDTAVFREAQRLVAEAARAGEDIVSDIADLQRSGDAEHLLFTGTLTPAQDMPAVTRICEIDLATGSIVLRSAGPSSDRQARLSRDGRTIAFLSDRGRAGAFQLYLLDTTNGTVTAGPTVAGGIEDIDWSPDGRRLLLRVASDAAELPSGQSAVATVAAADADPSWMPQVIGDASDCPWRAVWICDIVAGALRRISPSTLNVWEAGWCGDDHIIAVTSAEPGEGHWYGAALSLIEAATGAVTQLYAPTRQIALPAASPSGGAVAFVEAVASDRGYVAGDLRLCDIRDGACRRIDTGGVDVTSLEWRSNDLLLVAGHRGLETVVLSIDLASGTLEQLWKDTQATTAGAYASVIGLDHPDAFAFVHESFFNRPRVAIVQGCTMRLVPQECADWPSNGTADPVCWQAPDGLTIEGWLLRPNRAPPHATILHIHGGPVLHWRPYWLGRAPAVTMLLRRGYAIFLPNPRGSSGRGQDFAERVIGDIGGADTGDFLSGLDQLVAAGLVDPRRLGVMGLSYGGLMTCWLTTQDSRFAAAIAVGPATNHVSHHLLCNIPQFVRLFLRGDYADLTSAYYVRSPILHAHNSRTPTLLVAGDLDRCTPAEEAVQYHNALRENGVPSLVIRYPEEGHGVHGTPATIDFAARCVMWIERYIPPPHDDAPSTADAIDS